MKKLCMVILILAGVAMVLPMTSVYGQFQFMENQLVGKSSPDFTLDTVYQDKVNFSQFREGKKAIVFFWATWCPHCRVQLKELNELKKKFDDQNIKIVLVDLGESRKKVEKYLKKNKIDFDVFLDTRSEVETSYQIIGVPTFYFVNEKGNVTAVKHSLPSDYQTFLTKK